MANPATADPNVLWTLAEAFQDAAEAAIQRQQTPKYAGFIGHPIAFLQLRSIELALKASLLATGDQFKRVRKHSHGLQSLLQECQNRGIDNSLGLSADESELIASFSALYSEKWYEYPAHLGSTKPDVEEMQKVVGELIQRTRDFLRVKDAERGGLNRTGESPLSA